jgi:PEP-CTERM motif-containing protein
MLKFSLRVNLAPLENIIPISNTNSTGTVGEYVPGTGYSTILSGTTDSHIAFPIGLAVSGKNLFVTNNNNNTVSEYSLSGANNSIATRNNSFSIATPLNNPIGLAVNGNDLLVGNFNTGKVQAYSIAGGGSVDNSFTTISGVTNPEQIAIVPEPSSLGLVSLSLGLCGLLVLDRNRRLRFNA